MIVHHLDIALLTPWRWRWGTYRCHLYTGDASFNLSHILGVQLLPDVELNANISLWGEEFYYMVYDFATLLTLIGRAESHLHGWLASQRQFFLFVNHIVGSAEITPELIKAGFSTSSSSSHCVRRKKSDH